MFPLNVVAAAGSQISTHQMTCGDVGSAQKGYKASGTLQGSLVPDSLTFGGLEFINEIMDQDTFNFRIAMALNTPETAWSRVDITGTFNTGVKTVTIRRTDSLNFTNTVFATWEFTNILPDSLVFFNVYTVDFYS